MRMHISALFDFVGELARRRRQLADQMFAKIGLTHTEARLLTLLQEHGGASQQETLAQRITIDRSNVGRSLHRLEQQGYLERSQSDADKRAKLVQLTARGRSAIDEISVLRSEMAATFFGDLTEEEAKQVLLVLRDAIQSGDSRRRNG